MTGSPARLLALAIIAIALLGANSLPATPDSPHPVSPGGRFEARTPAASCPTFSWGGSAEAQGYDLALYRVGDDRALQEVLTVTVSGDARSWTPALDECPQSGVRYAWSVRARVGGKPGPWSEALLFETQGPPSDDEVRQALEVLLRHQLDRDPGAAGRRDSTEAHSADRQPLPESVAIESDLPRAAVAEMVPASSPPVPRQVVTPPASFSLNLDGSLDLGGHIFKNGAAFVHNDGGIADANTALGLHALVSLSTGNGKHNTAVGRYALRQTTFGDQNTAVGSDALVSNIQGSLNTAVGYRALGTNANFGSHTAVGAFALYSNVSSNPNTGLGSNALRSNTSGFFNTAVGYAALYANQTGQANSALGHRALESNTGSHNTALGSIALQTNASGGYNTALGSQALTANLGGTYNTAVGFKALDSNTGGTHNTALGSEALSANTSGAFNVAIGRRSALNLSTGSHNITIGNVYGPVSGESYTTRLGGLQTRAFVAGIRGTTTGAADAIPVLIDSSGQLGTVSSSARFKEGIRSLGDLSTPVLDLRPVAFRYRKPFADGGKPVQFGLIAEEVAEVFPELVVVDDQGRPETVKYHLLSILLLNETQRQQRDLERLRRQVERLTRERDPTDLRPR